MLCDKRYHPQGTYLFNLNFHKRKKGGKRYVPAGNCSLYAHFF
jgi:hypothetical protein